MVNRTAWTNPSPPSQKEAKPVFIPAQSDIYASWVVKGPLYTPAEILTGRVVAWEIVDVGELPVVTPVIVGRDGTSVGEEWQHRRVVGSLADLEAAVSAQLSCAARLNAGRQS